jgi:hypothetical protein
MGKYVIETPHAFIEQLKLAAFDVELYEMPHRSATRILTPGSKYVVEIAVELGAKLKSMFCGEWCVTVAAESIGPGVERSIQKIFAMNNCDTRPDKISIDLPSDWFDEGHENPACKTCGTVYNLVATVVAQDSCRHHPIGIAGFAKLGDVMVYSKEAATA